jgi:hypothetical protein
VKSAIRRVVGTFAVPAIVDQAVFATSLAHLLDGFGINAQPKQREIANVTVDFSLGEAAGASTF